MGEDKQLICNQIGALTNAMDAFTRAGEKKKAKVLADKIIELSAKL